MSSGSGIDSGAAAAGFFDHAGDLLAVSDARGRITAVNAAWTRQLGWHPEDMVGHVWFDLLHPDDRARAGLAAMRLLEPGTECAGLVLRVRDATGAWRTLECRSRSADDGRVFSVGREQSPELRRAAERAWSAEARFRRIVESAHEAIWTVDLTGQTTFVNPGAARLTGRTMGELIDCNVLDVVHPDDRERVREGLAARARGESERYELRMVRPDGEVRWLEIAASPLTATDGTPVGALGVLDDVTERRQALSDLAAARDRFELAFLHAPIGMGIVGADGRITAGNPALRGLTGHADEELVGVLWHELLAPDDRPAAMRAVRALLRGDVSALRHEGQIIHHAGHAVWVEASATPVRDKDGAVQSIVVQLHDITAHRREAAQLREELEELAWVERIRHALDHDDFVVHLQPIVCARTGERLHEELLVRMRVDDRIAMPGEFLGVAERHGLVPAIDGWVVDQAAGLAAAGRSVQVNVSARSVGDEEFVTALGVALSAHGAPPERMTFELTETALADDMEQARAFAARLHELGIGLALDDFGVGWASLQYLKTLPGLRSLKIDMEFVRDLLHDEPSRSVVSAIVGLARTFGLETVAEGVEQPEQAELLRELGVDALQGYLIGRPAPLA